MASPDSPFPDPDRAEQEAQCAAARLKDEIAALRERVRSARAHLSQSAGGGEAPRSFED